MLLTTRNLIFVFSLLAIGVVTNIAMVTPESWIAGAVGIAILVPVVFPYVRRTLRQRKAERLHLPYTNRLLGLLTELGHSGTLIHHEDEVVLRYQWGDHRRAPFWVIVRMDENELEEAQSSPGSLVTVLDEMFVVSRGHGRVVHEVHGSRMMCDENGSLVTVDEKPKPGRRTDKDFRKFVERTGVQYADTSDLERLITQLRDAESLPGRV